MFNEEWASIEDFDAHCAQSYISEFFNKYVQDPATSITADCSVRIFSDEI
jgi:quinol monooxygenase YgiN